ncbi:unnamed protein product [Linum tenue]|uniref:FAD-binding PCMH-type domain-containing protein n=1 Tax=Linum tenue TaxID=586396 RepID=A0AAV0QL72_9ROSI|nr:unnamed protein product [Linum tenue]
MDTAHRSFPILVALFVLLFGVTSSQPYEEFLQCLEFHDSNITSIVYTRANSSFSSLLESSIRNPRFDTSATPKPLLIFTPRQISHIQSAIRCSRAHRIQIRKHKFQIRIRSGGHDYEGLSYTSPDHNSSFLILDLISFRNISIDLAQQTAWIQPAVTTGELYYRIAEKSSTLAFPSGICPTVGLGGQISGGGWGTLLRKYGLAADNVLDTRVIDAEGRILDRASMGEDMFWAIRGGGGNTFGIVIAWKIKLVPVPASVTACTVTRTLEQNATEIVHRWQYVVDKLSNDVFFMVVLNRVVNPIQANATTIQASFNSLYLGSIEGLILMMEAKFPDLGLRRENCVEMSWAKSILYFAGFPLNSPLESLLDRTISATGSAKFKGKSDYVKEPIPISGFEGIWEKLKEVGVQTGGLILASYGGKMSEIPESSIPFPHRAGNIYQVEEVAFWVEDGVEAADGYLNWLRGLYEYMTPYVSKNPREAYANYRDLDIGRNGGGGEGDYRRARSWGSSYYKNNFDRLVRVKTAVDPANFFRNEQSIPPLSSWR